MKTKVVSFMLLLHLVPSTVKTEMCGCFDDPCLRKALQTELTSTPTNIQQLQNMFYSSNNFQGFIIDTYMTVNITCEPSHVCNSPVITYDFSWDHIWYEDTFTSVVRELILRPSMFGNPVTVFLSVPQLFVSIVQGIDIGSSLNIQTNCVSEDEPDQVEVENFMREIWEGILQWSKAYARAGGPVPAPSDSDKGQVYSYCLGFDCSIEQPDATFSSTFLAFYIILNLVVGVLLVVLVPSLIVKKNVSSATSSLFWSSAIIGAPFTLIFMATKVAFTIVALFGNHGIFDNVFERVFTSITCALLLFLLTVELVVAILRSKRSVLAVPRCVGYCCSVACFCCFCCCCRPGGRSHSRVARALALWFVMAWLQLIAASIVPVTITVLTTDPLYALAVLAMLVSTFFGMVVFLAVLVLTCSQHDRSKQRILFTYSVIFVGVLVLVCLAIFLFLVINVHGVQVNSIPGFIGTLVPSAILSIITLIVKAKVFGKKPTEADQQEQDETTMLL